MNRFEFPIANSGTSEDDESTNFNVSKNDKTDPISNFESFYVKQYIPPCDQSNLFL